MKLLRRVARAAIPLSIRELPRILRRKRAARLGWKRRGEHRAPVTRSELEELARRYPPAADDAYAYDPESLASRGEMRARMVSQLLREGCGVVLEVGAADGMVLAALARRGYTAHGVDTTRDRADPRATAVGVQMRVMDAAHLEFPDGMFDCAFSFSTFEHADRPDLVLAEMVRVTRPGGHVWVEFSHLGWAPHGAHLYHEIGVPYVTLLASEEVIDEVVRATTGWKEPRDRRVNNWPIERYRAALDSIRSEVVIERATERRNWYHGDIIAAYAGRFASAPSLDALTVEGVEWVLRRR